jgi:hypothetical protein
MRAISAILVKKNNCKPKNAQMTKSNHRVMGWRAERNMCCKAMR